MYLKNDLKNFPIVLYIQLLSLSNPSIVVAIQIVMGGLKSSIREWFNNPALSVRLE
jgi:hypothetical protein